MQKRELKTELKIAELPPQWETIIQRLYNQKAKHPSGASTRFGGKAKMVMEVAFRTWEDHFTVWTGGTWGEGGSITHTFILNHDGSIDLKFQTSKAA
jgi:hypothetical protein